MPPKEIIKEVVKDPGIISWLFGFISVIFGGVAVFLTKRVIDLPKNYVSKEDFLEHRKTFDAEVVRIYDNFGEKVDGINKKIDAGFNRIYDKIDGVKK